MSRSLIAKFLTKISAYGESGINDKIIKNGISYAYDILDQIDEKLVEAGSPRLSQIVELANLSSILGNLIGGGIAENSNGSMERNKPHSYPDLLAINEEFKDIEIKIALESNKPKGHLAKEGYYLTCRYVLGSSNGSYVRGKTNRGDVIWIWEIRFGYLLADHFSLSSTPGDSGKTAVINAEGFKELSRVY